MGNKSKKTLPPQHQEKQPGMESMMNPQPIYDRESYQGSGKLKGKVAIVTGGDSGIGRSVAILFAKEGADIVIAYLDEHEDATKTKELVEGKGVRCLLLPGDLGYEPACQEVVKQTIQQFGKVDIVVNNIAQQYPVYDMEQLIEEQLDKTFRTNVYSFYFMIKAVLPHLKRGSCIINTTSVTAYEGNEMLLDYSATKGAIVSLTRSLSKHLVGKEIRVNAVAPGPIWTPLIPSSFTAEKVSEFGSNVPMGKPGQPIDCAPAYVYLASEDSSYVTGQVMHVNGGVIVNG